MLGNKRLAITAVFTAVLVAFAAGYAVADINTSPHRTIATTDGGSDLSVRSCVIRWQKVGSVSEPSLFINSAHTCSGIASVTVNHDDGVVSIVPDSSIAPVMYAAATADETFARMGISAGVSAASNLLVIKMSRKGVALRGDHPALAHPLGNIWLLVVSA